ncbi:hypothetical protein OS493_021042 [Desmophyllum pertusum]|uniref:Uncharacterized protein n=1 Tax=Desmophyllum pertusum TaxID=174260 RepID=A0A9X0A0A5_9CNID|nr:hypothetical protein OS493_021042 [Desmophyllum pertusum]
MSLNFVLLLVLVSFEVKLAISLNCQPPHNCENVTSKNNTQLIETLNCGPSNVSCGFAKVCREGLCVDVEPSTPDEGRQFPSKMPKNYRTEESGVQTTPSSRYRHQSTAKSSHSLISGNQEFAIALVGFSILFINFCLVSFCLARMKRRRLQDLQQLQLRTAATQSSQTDDVWNEAHMTRNEARSEVLDMGIENFALNGEMDAFSNEFLFPQVRLPPYDFSSAYHKPRPRTGESDEDGGEGEPSDAAAFDTQSIGSEDPPPYAYCEQRCDSSACSPPSYDEALNVLATDVEENTSGL